MWKTSKSAIRYRSKQVGESFNVLSSNFSWLWPNENQLKLELRTSAKYRKTSSELLIGYSYFILFMALSLGITGCQAKKAKNQIGMEFVWIPQGNFEMGNKKPAYEEENEEPAHSVTLSQGFWLGITEVTQEQWQLIAKYNPSDNPGCNNCPVTKVSWEEAQRFIKDLNARGDGTYRLLTEAEWEYAARAGSDNYGGNLNEMLWPDDLGSDDIHPVAGKKANTFGLYDMPGNVREWVYDRFGEYSIDSTVDPKGPRDGQNERVIRGACVGDSICRVTRREFLQQGEKRFDLGFRLAKE